MNLVRTLCLISLMAFCVATVVGQNASTPHSDDGVALKKAKFELGLEMLKGYRGDLQDRLEKTTALLIIVIGWLITSDTARKSINSNSLLFWGGVVVLTALVGMYCLTVYNFIGRFREIQTTVERLSYIEPQYFARYRMPDSLYLSPIAFSYIAPVLLFYIFILLILFQIRFRFIPLPKTPDSGK